MKRRFTKARRPDLLELRLFQDLLAAIPEEMGVRLRRAAFSPNIKERLDFSCALTGRDGGLVAQASHIPVHLGSAHLTARHLLEALEFEPGDMVLLNDPWAGGTHLPDITLFAPVFVGREKTAAFGVLVRAHHADIGGATPGSMGPALDLFGEGLVIPPVKLLRRGRLQDDVLQFVLANTRTPEERRGDLLAQMAAVTHGVDRLRELVEDHGTAVLDAAVAALRSHAARSTRTLLRRLRPGCHEATLLLDGIGSPRLWVRLQRVGGKLRVDFTGTDAQIAAPLNANRAITVSCLFYVLRLLLDHGLPTNAGCLDPVEIVLPEGSLLNARRPAAVAGGNVETSQRVVDLLLLAFAKALPGEIAACSQGTMNNLTVGGLRSDGSAWTFYETLGGGAGASADGPGADGLQVHMTNTLNTPVEALEAAFPVRVTRYHLRDGSGGDGLHHGGEGLVREMEMLEPAQVTILATRRKSGAPGLAGGGVGKPGRDTLLRQSGQATSLDGSVHLEAGESVRIETPGGGGYGKPIPRRARKP
ncbi:MAG: hydantoinase B/oxoprolinase family protein [Planctomycetes bacterium]|nr:hydantoinase B/oxoprolinase family protein [Planctomycetota bacterium]